MRPVYHVDRAGQHCAKIQRQFIAPAGRKSGPCPHCRLIHTDSTGNWRVDSRTEQIGYMIPEKWFVLPPAMAWYYRRTHSDYLPLPPYRPGHGEMSVSDRNLTLIYPDPEGAIYVPVELSGRRGRTVFEAAHRKPGVTLFWHLDDDYLGDSPHVPTLDMQDEQQSATSRRTP